jgi:alkyldihydroxyacetonephosphate synthase
MTPVPPIALERVDGAPRSHIDARRVTVGDATLGRLRDACADVTTNVADVGDASRDWWPLAMQWALEGEVPGLASVIARPRSADEVAAVLAVCNADLVPAKFTAYSYSSTGSSASSQRVTRTKNS